MITLRELILDLADRADPDRAVLRGSLHRSLCKAICLVMCLLVGALERVSDGNLMARKPA